MDAHETSEDKTISANDGALQSFGSTTAHHHQTELEVNSLLERRIKDWGESGDVAREQLEWFQENAMALLGNQERQGETFTTALFDLFAALLNPPVSAPTKYLLKFYLWRCEMPLADTLLKHETPAHWWRDLGISKWMCFKMADEFCDSLKLPRRSNQRNAKARRKMSVKRLAPQKKRI